MPIFRQDHVEAATLYSSCCWVAGDMIELLTISRSLIEEGCRTLSLASQALPLFAFFPSPIVDQILLTFFVSVGRQKPTVTVVHSVQDCQCHWIKVVRRYNAWSRMSGGGRGVRQALWKTNSRKLKYI